MGMYTGVKLDVLLKSDTPAKILEVLDFMLDGDSVEPPSARVDRVLAGATPHPMFDTDRWSWMFRGTSVYLKPDFEPDSYRQGLRLHVCFNIKNYTSEIERFLDWLSPYVESLVEGCYQYEEMAGPVPVELRSGKLVIGRTRT